MNSKSFLCLLLLLSNNPIHIVQPTSASNTLSSWKINTTSDNFCKSKECATCLEYPTMFQRYMCFQHWLRDVVRNDATQFIPATCAVIQLQKTEIVFDCHWLMHGVTEGLFYSTTEANDDLPTLDLTMQEIKTQALEQYRMCTTSCDWACYHAVAAGYVRELVQQKVETSNFHIQIDDLCAALSVSQPNATDVMQAGLFFQCYHGVGHGLIWIWDENSALANPMVPVNTALTVCDSLPRNKFRPVNYFCRTGLYMQLWENHMKPLRNGRNDQTFEQLRPTIITLMVKLCNDHSLGVNACGEVWANAGLLETYGDKKLSVAACNSAYAQMKRKNSDIQKFCIHFVNTVPPPELNKGANFCKDDCGLLCEPTGHLEPLTTTTTTTTTTTETPTHSQPSTNPIPSDKPPHSTENTSPKPITENMDSSEGLNKSKKENEILLQNILLASGAAAIVICVCICSATVCIWMNKKWSYDIVLDADETMEDNRSVEEGMIQMSSIITKGKKRLSDKRTRDKKKKKRKKKKLKN